VTLPAVATRTQALSVYRTLLLVRLAEERIRAEYPRDEMKTPVHLGIGGEAIPVGVCACLPAGTRTFGTYRNHGLYLAVTGDTDGFFAELYGKATGAGKGKAGSMHLAAPSQGLMATSAVVGTTIPLAVGAALANAYRGSSDVVAVFFGDGALEEGVFWESLNFASLRRLRVLFVCEDNGLAIHAPASERRGFRSITKAVAGFECHTLTGNGSDVDEVMARTGGALRAVAERPGPALLHLRYFRFLEHVGPGEDFDHGYRRQPSAAQRRKLDPVLRCEAALRAGGVDAAELDRVRRSVQAQIDGSVRAAQSAPFPAPSELETDVWA
jgi:TPP-dependent pyruvate/acetoin dehydrogenase alpha subunit